jgi:small-conductance mechanosensitive channel
LHLPCLQAGECIQAFDQGVAALEGAAGGILAELAQADSDQGGGQQQQELVHRLQAAMDGLSQEHTTVRRSMEALGRSNTAQHVELLQQLPAVLHPAAELAAAVQAY